jgi:site-specific DNA recombinase
MPGIGFYARVSTDEQREQQTIENQIEYATGRFKLDKIQCDKWYIENGVTGTIALEDRPEGKRVLDDATSGELKTLYIYKMDRLGRITKVTLGALWTLEALGINIVSMTEPFDMSTPAGKFMVTIMAGQAQLDRDVIVERLRQGMDRAARAGKWLYGIVPYGYQVINRYLVIYEPEAETVRLIFKLIVERDYSCRLVADHLNALGVSPISIAPGSGKRKKDTATVWQTGRIRNLVHEPCYKGVTYYCGDSKLGRDTIPRPCPPIVSEETWELAHEVLAGKKVFTGRQYKHEYLLSGMIHCSVCGLTYIGTTNKEYNIGYYRCGGKTQYRAKAIAFKKCKNNNIHQEDVECYVWDMCVQFITNPQEALSALVGHPAPVRNIKAEMAALTKNLHDKDAEKERVITLFRKQYITESDVESQIEDITSERKIIERQIHALKEENRQTQKNKELQDNAKALLERLHQKIHDGIDCADKREIIKTIVKEIIVYPKKRVEVTFKFYPPVKPSIPCAT